MYSLLAYAYILEPWSWSVPQTPSGSKWSDLLQLKIKMFFDGPSIAKVNVKIQGQGREMPKWFSATWSDLIQVQTTMFQFRGRPGMLAVLRTVEFLVYFFDNDVYTRPPVLTSALCDLDLRPPDLEVDRFMPLPRGPLVPLRQNRVDEIHSRRTDGRTEGQTDS